MGTRRVGVFGVAGLDHVVLHVGPEPVLRPEDRRQRDARLGCDAVEDVPEAGIDRRRDCRPRPTRRPRSAPESMRRSLPSLTAIRAMILPSDAGARHLIPAPRKWCQAPFDGGGGRGADWRAWALARGRADRRAARSAERAGPGATRNARHPAGHRGSRRGGRTSRSSATPRSSRATAARCGSRSAGAAARRPTCGARATRPSCCSIPASCTTSRARPASGGRRCSVRPGTPCSTSA